jgi:hypothetical protein
MRAIKSATVLPFPSNDDTPPQKPYSLDVISAVPVNGMVLIEACVPLAAVEAFRKMLEAGSY